VGAYVPVPKYVGKYVGPFDSSLPGKGSVRTFVGYAVDVGAYVFVAFDFFGYAVEVGAYVFVLFFGFFGIAVEVGAYVFVPLDFFG